MGRQLKAMTAEVRFGALLAPVLGAVDDAGIAVAAARMLQGDPLPPLDVMPLGGAAELTERSLYVLLGDAVGWHAMRLLIEQGKLANDARVPVRIFLEPGQWRKAGIVAHVAEIAHRTSVKVKRPRRAVRPAAV